MAQQSSSADLAALEQAKRLAAETVNQDGDPGTRSAAEGEERRTPRVTRELRQRRRRFLELIEKFAPEVVEALRRCSTAASSAEEEQALTVWQANYGLSAPWILDAARSTVYAMRHDPTVSFFAMRLNLVREEGRTVTAPWGRLVPYEPATGLIFLPVQGWQPNLETRAEAVARAAQESKLQFQRHLDEVERAEGGRIGTREHRGGDRDRHLRWLVLRQCKQMSWSAIGAPEYAGKNTVKYGVHAAAREMDIVPRSAKRGRPPKSQTEKSTIIS